MGIDLCILSKHPIFKRDLLVLYKTYYWLSKLSFLISLVYIFFSTSKLKRDALKSCMPYVVVHILCGPLCAAHAVVQF